MTQVWHLTSSSFKKKKSLKARVMWEKQSDTVIHSKLQNKYWIRQKHRLGSNYIIRCLSEIEVNHHRVCRSSLYYTSFILWKIFFCSSLWQKKNTKWYEEINGLSVSYFHEFTYIFYAVFSSFIVLKYVFVSKLFHRLNGIKCSTMEPKWQQKVQK